MAARRGRYASLIEPDLWAFIDRINTLYPSDVAGLPLAEQREIYDRMSAAFHAGRLSGLAVRDEIVSGRGNDVPIRRYRVAGREAKATILYFHGGGFVFGGLDSHDDICAELCDATGFDLVSVDYRLAPEHVHPAAFKDAMAAFEAVAKSGMPVILCGESAGGAIAAAVAHATRADADRPMGQVLIYPVLGGDVTTGSYVEHAHAPLLATADVAFYRLMRGGGRTLAADPTFEPLGDTDFAGLPPTVIVTAQFDPLASDGEVYAGLIRNAGGLVQCIEAERLVHGFLRARTTVARAGRAFARIIDSVSELGGGK